MEGTDATILRAGELVRGLGDAGTLSRALTVVKVAKPAPGYAVRCAGGGGGDGTSDGGSGGDVSLCRGGADVAL